MVLICLMVSLWSFNYVVKFERLQAQFEFRKLTLSSAGSISLRIRNYAQVLTGTAAHMGVNQRVDPAALEKYVEGLNLARTSAGILGVGYIRAVQADDQTVLERNLDGQQDLMMENPSAEEGAEQLILIEITAEKGKAHFEEIAESGDDSLHTGLNTARATRAPALVQIAAHGDEETGDLLMIHAVYATQPEAGQDAFIGWAVLAFSTENALNGVVTHFGVEYDLTVFNAGSGVSEPLFTSAQNAEPVGAFVEEYPIETYGSTWLLRFVSTPRFDAAYRSYFPHLLLLLGLLFTMLVASALKSTALRHRAWKSMAEFRARQLGAREDENRALVDTSVSVVMVLDEEERITFANEGAAALFGCARIDIEGRDLANFVTFNTMEQRCDLCNAAGLLPSGEFLMLDVQTNTWRTAEETTHTSVLIRDMTEQIKGRKAIEALHQRYEIALTGAGIGIFEIDTVTDRAEMSDTWHKMMGTDACPESFARKRDLIRRVHPDDLPAMVAAYRECMSGEVMQSIFEFRVWVNGCWRWMSSHAVPVARGADGRVTKLIGAQTDVTDLREARNALELSEARFRMVVEDAPVGMAVMNEVGTFIGVNAALARLSGYEVGALLKKMRLAELLSRKDFVQLSHDVRNLLKSGVTKTYQNQFQLRTRSRELRWGLFNLSWTFDSNLSEYVYIAQIVDITDQKRVEQIKSEFVATVSHELRTPLTSIKGALGLLGVAGGDALPDKAHRLLDIASVNADRLTTLVNDILDLEKISSGEVPFEFEAVPLQEIITHTLDEMQGMAGDHGNTLVSAADDPAVLVHVDAGRMQQVLRNLVSNACKFSDVDTLIVVRVEEQDDTAIIYVENTGPPVPESFREQIFDAFTQVDGSDTRRMGGTGLGLNIAKQIVMRLGGRMGFEQKPASRTVFWFTCPLALEDISEMRVG